MEEKSDRGNNSARKLNDKANTLKTEKMKKGAIYQNYCKTR